MRNIIAAVRTMQGWFSGLGPQAQFAVAQARSNVPKAQESVSRYRKLLNVPSMLVIAVFFLVEMVSNVLQDIFTTLDSHLIAAGVLLVAVMYLTYKFTRTFERVAMNQVGTPVNCKLQNRRGLVVLVGLDAAEPGSPLSKLLARSSSLEYLALVGTPETQENGVINDILSKLMVAAGRDLPATHIRTSEWGNALSIADSEQAVSEAITWMLRRGVSARDAVVDISSGRRAMAFGALTAGAAHDVEVQYLASAWDHRTNTPIKGVESFKVVRELWDDGIDEVPSLTPV